MKRLPLLFLGGLCALQPMPATDYTPIVPRLHAVVEQEMREWAIPGVALALIDDQTLVHAAGFGEARRDSIFRAGSISKLFNAVAVMQQVERGTLDLDAPIPPEVTPVNPFPDQPPVTLRHLLSHRSGFQRESAVGGYFDASQPGIEATVRSLAGGVLVTRPAEKTRYSNCGPTVAGWMVARAGGLDFEAYQRKHLLDPLGMTSSFWTLAATPRDRLIPSYLRLADGQGGWSRIACPVFDLGTIPAGNLFTTVEDLGRFASALIAGGRGLLKPESLAAMWKPQFTEEAAGFGLGFVVGSFRGHRTIGHNGAVYGHSASFVVLPESRLAVVVIANEDIINGRIRRISDAALSLMLETRNGEKPDAPAPAPLPPNAASFAGDFESQSFWARLELEEGVLRGELSGQPIRLQPTGGLTFLGDSRIDASVPVEFLAAPDGSIRGFTWGQQRFERVPPATRPLPGSWRNQLGRYGPDFIPIIISERHGHLYAMTENMVDYRLTPVTPHVFALPPGMYVDEEIVFHPRPDGTIHGMEFAFMTFTKHP